MKLFRIIILLSVVTSLVVFLCATDFAQVTGLLRRTGNKFWLLILTTGIAYLFATISWWYCMGEQRKHISVFRLFFIRHVGETVSLFNPASIIAGEAIKAWMLRDYPLRKSSVNASLLVSRTLLIVTQLVLFAGALIFLFATRPAPVVTADGVLQAVMWLGGAVLSGMLLFRGIKKLRTAAPFRYVAQKTAGWRAAARETIADCRALYQSNRTDLVLAFVFAVLHWIVGSLEFYFILRFLGAHAHVITSLLADMGVVLFKSAGAFIPGQAGIEEYGNKIMLELISVSGTAIWIAASVLRRTRQLFWLLAGLLAYMLIRRTAGMAYQS